jgi:hypothetical protein
MSISIAAIAAGFTGFYEVLRSSFTLLRFTRLRGHMRFYGGHMVLRAHMHISPFFRSHPRAKASAARGSDRSLIGGRARKGMGAKGHVNAF